MANNTNVQRQYVLTMEQAFDFEDFAFSPVRIAPKLQAGAILIAPPRIVVDVAFNGSTPTLSIGILGSTTKYATTLALTAGTLTGAAVTGTALTAEETLLLTPNAGAIASTAGRGRFIFEYIVVNRGNEVNP